MFNSTSAVVNGQTVDRSGNTAIADTGTTLALVDDATCQAIYNAIPGGKYDANQQGYIFPTSTAVDKLPTVSFDMGGKQFAVEKEDLAFADAGNGMSYGGIQSRGTMTFDILGDTWLKGIYAVSGSSPDQEIEFLWKLAELIPIDLRPRQNPFWSRTEEGDGLKEGTEGDNGCDRVV